MIIRHMCFVTWRDSEGNTRGYCDGAGIQTLNFPLAGRALLPAASPAKIHVHVRRTFHLCFYIFVWNFTKKISNYIMKYYILQ